MKKPGLSLKNCRLAKWLYSALPDMRRAMAGRSRAAGKEAGARNQAMLRQTQYHAEAHAAVSVQRFIR